jgi:hypothetical protein
MDGDPWMEMEESDFHSMGKFIMMMQVVMVFDGSWMVTHVVCCQSLRAISYGFQTFKTAIMVDR